MEEKDVPRQLSAHLQKAAAEFPAVLQAGRRQSGKTTLLKHLFSGEYPIISLEPPDVRLAAQSDPRALMRASARFP